MTFHYTQMEIINKSVVHFATLFIFLTGLEVWWVCDWVCLCVLNIYLHPATLGNTHYTSKLAHFQAHVCLRTHRTCMDTIEKKNSSYCEVVAITTAVFYLTIDLYLISISNNSFLHLFLSLPFPFPLSML